MTGVESMFLGEMFKRETAFRIVSNIFMFQDLIALQDPYAMTALAM